MKKNLKMEIRKIIFPQIHCPPFHQIKAATYDVYLQKLIFLFFKMPVFLFFSCTYLTYSVLLVKDVLYSDYTTQYIIQCSSP